MKKQSPQLTQRELREFGLVTGAIVAALFGLLLPWLLDRPFPIWPWVVSALLLAWALLLPTTLMPVYRGWMALGHVLGWLNTRIILALLFYSLILPVGLIMRLLGNDPMARKIDNSRNTYRVLRSHPNPSHVERPY